MKKKLQKSVKMIPYKIKFIDSARFMATSLSNFVYNLTEGIHKIKCKHCECFLEYDSVKDHCIKCLAIKNSNKIYEELKNWFKSTFRFSKNNINRFILLLRKGVYPYEYMDDGKSLIKQYYLKKKSFIAT